MILLNTTEVYTLDSLSRKSLNVLLINRTGPMNWARSGPRDLPKFLQTRTNFFVHQGGEQKLAFQFPESCKLCLEYILPNKETNNKWCFSLWFDAFSINPDLKIKICMNYNFFFFFSFFVLIWWGNSILSIPLSVVHIDSKLVLFKKFLPFSK